MKCCHCSHNAFTTIDGAALCLNCHTDFQNTSNSNISSAFQLSRGIAVADSMIKARVNSKHLMTNERIAEVNTYNTHNNITVHGNNNGILNAGKAQINSNDIGIAKPSKSGINISLLTKFIANVLKLIALCQQPLKRLLW